MSKLREWAHRALHRMGIEVRRTVVTERDYELDLYRRLYAEESLRGRRFYNIGAGNFFHPFWTNVDYESEWYAANTAKTRTGLSYNLLSLEPLPVESGTAELVYSSHTVEHVTDEAVQNLLREAHRILKPGGRLRITTPDIDLDYRAYRENDRHYYYWIEMYSRPENYRASQYKGPFDKASTAQIFLSHFASSLSTMHADGAEERIGDEELARLFDTLPYEEAFDRITARCPLALQQKYPGNHINWFNAEKLGRLMREAGFATVHRSGCGQSHAAVLRNRKLFDATDPWISLFMEARKG